MDQSMADGASIGLRRCLQLPDLPRCGRDWELLYAEGPVSGRFPRLDQSYDQTDHSQSRHGRIDVKVDGVGAHEQDTEDEPATKDD